MQIIISAPLIYDLLFILKCKVNNSHPLNTLNQLEWIQVSLFWRESQAEMSMALVDDINWLWCVLLDQSMKLVHLCAIGHPVS